MSGVDFRRMAPITPEGRRVKAPKVTRLLNDAVFQFSSWEGDKIFGHYVDYTGAWTPGIWDDHGRVGDRQFAEHDLNWRTGNTPASEAEE